MPVEGIHAEPRSTDIRPGKGTLVMIGGREDKHGDRTILKTITSMAQCGPIAVATLASDEPLKQWEMYCRAFGELGASDLQHLHIETREGASELKNIEMVERSSLVFFTGGDQVQISGKLGGTPLLNCVRRLYEERRGVVAGTSAGASAMGASMLMSHATEESHKVGGAFFMARGLGLVPDLVIDQHFAQRARIERLVGAVAEDPGVLGIGIDEDTAVVLKENTLRVIGSGAVYVADGRGITYTNVSERTPNQTLCLFDLRLHVLSEGATYELEKRRPGLNVSPSYA
jgi:cyanophycinase